MRRAADRAAVFRRRALVERDAELRRRGDADALVEPRASGRVETLAQQTRGTCASARAGGRVFHDFPQHLVGQPGFAVALAARERVEVAAPSTLKSDPPMCKGVRRFTPNTGAVSSYRVDTRTESSAEATRRLDLGRSRNLGARRSDHSSESMISMSAMPDRSSKRDCCPSPSRSPRARAV